MTPSLENAVSPFAGGKARKGLTLIEAAMVLTVLALVVGAVMLYYSGANLSKKTSATAGQIGIIQQAVKSLYAGQPNYLGLSNAVVSPSLPRSMSDSNPANLYHAFGGPIFIVPVDVGGGANSGYRIFLNGLPTEVCLKLGALDFGLSVNIMRVSGNLMTFPVTPAQLLSQCSLVPNGKASIEWNFY